MTAWLIAQLLFADPTGHAVHPPVPIPNDPALVGLQLFAQGAAPDTSLASLGNTLGVVLSNAVRVVVQ